MLRLALVLVLLLPCLVHADPPAAASNAPVAPAATAPPAPWAPSTTVAPDGCTLDVFAVPSPSMGRDIKVTVVLPPGYAENPERKYPVLYALHGRAAPYDSFSAMMPLRQALKEKPMIVACMDADIASWYIDAPKPQKWSRVKEDTTTAKSLFNTFFFDEYIPALDKKYRIHPDQRMLTGFSMGGYGAFRYMLEKPAMFKSVSEMSGAFWDLANPSDKAKEHMTPLLGTFEENKAGYVGMDLYTQIRAAKEKGTKFPPLCLRCGTDDKLLPQNQQMRDFLKEQGIAAEYQEAPGKHDWSYWKETSPQLIDFHWASLQEAK